MTLHEPLVTTQFLSRGAAFYWEPGLVWLQAVSGLAIGLALLAMVGGLAYLGRERSDLRGSGWLRLFAALLFLLALVQLAGVWTIWNPAYLSETTLKLLTGLVAVVAATLWWRRLPSVRLLPNPYRLERELEQQAAELERCRRQCEADAARAAELEGQLAERSAALQRSEQNLEQQAYIVSHDLQEPLRMVVGFSQLLEKRYGEQLDDEGREFIGLTVESAGRMSAMLGDLLQLSRVGREPVSPQPVELQRALDAAVAQLEGELEAAGVELTVQPLPMVQGNEQMLIRVFRSLLDNAVKFRSDVPLRIGIDAERVDGQWQVRVRDNGIGLDPKFADRIFQAFQRLHTVGEYPGTGIGLALVRRIIERHGGQVGVESAPQEGATFWFTLPAAERAEP